MSRGVQRCPEVSRVQPGVETAASAALQFSTPVELGLRMLVGWLVGWLVLVFLENGSKDFSNFLHEGIKR